MARASELRKFTLDEYEEYLNQPIWMADSPRFNSEEEQESYWVATINDWRNQSKHKFNKWKSVCRKELDALEQISENLAEAFNTERAVANESLPLIKAEILEQVAMLTSNYPQPTAIALQEEQNTYVAGLNVIKEMIFKMNHFDDKVKDAVYTAKFYNLAIFKTSVDDTQPGVFGQPQRICIDTIDPENCHPDPKATKWDWDHMSFVILDHYLELGKLRKMYPDRGFLVPEAVATVDYARQQEHEFGDYLQSPVPKITTGVSTTRKIVRISECWFKDSRLKFEAETETVENKPGDQEYDSDMPEEYLRPRLDEDGYVVGSWVPAFPNGRCIVIAGNFVVLDIVNPFLHGEAPVVFMPMSPSHEIDIPGDAFSLAKVIRKINSIQKRIMRYAQSEIERPMLADVMALPAPRQWLALGTGSRDIIWKNASKEFARIPPTEIPQFTFPLLQWLQNITDQVMGSSSISRGNISDGAQLSAEALNSLQSYASSRLKLQAEYIGEAMKKLGRQVCWLIRQTYDQKITCQVAEPDGTQITIDWHKDWAEYEQEGERKRIEGTEDYLVDIQVGTGLPAAQQQMSSMALNLFRERAIDQQALLQAMKYPDWAQIVDRMKQRRQEEIMTQAAGRAFGDNIKSIEKENQSPGRKNKD
jgi:hypothetical protein